MNPLPLLLLALLPAPATAASDNAQLKLHVPSPEWRDQVIYFLMLDRFNDGDPANNDQGTGEFDPSDPARFSGGDLRGVEQQLDYIQGLGATAVWITPPVANQWWQPEVKFGGYHGYWTEDFSAVDAHFGQLEDYQRLADALHRRGMYLIQDIVVNHTANYFSCRQPAPAGESCPGYQRHPDARGQGAPSQAPFDDNGPAPGAAIYHFTPDVSDYSNRDQELQFQMSGLDDLNTDNPLVRQALRRSYGEWIRKVGVDAFRVDTAFFVPPEFFADFLDADEPTAPGMLRVAAATGRTGFHVFGEGFAVDRAYEDHASRKIAGYVRERGGHLPAMLNFPLYGSLAAVFARGQPPDELAYRIRNLWSLFPDPGLMPAFVDNHDVDRFLAGGDEAGLRQSLLLLYTLPGIPTIYYGTEQGFTVPRKSMFRGGWGAGETHHFDRKASLYRYLAELAAMRRELPVLSRGQPTMLRANAVRPGLLAWRMDGAGSTALVLMNSADHPVLVDALETGLPKGSKLHSRMQLAAAPSEHRLDARGRLTTVLAPRSASVFEVLAGTVRDQAPDGPGDLRLERPRPRAGADQIELHGHAGRERPLQIIVDGDLGAPVLTHSDARGRFRATIITGNMTDGRQQHRVVVRDLRSGRVSNPRFFKVRREWRMLAEVEDPSGDDTGPDGRYVYPADNSWRQHRQADLKRIRVFGAGSALRIEVELNSITQVWNPPNGFDHVALTLFLGRDAPGSELMPLQNARLPDGMRWQLRLRSHGWSNALFAADTADSGHEGSPLPVGAAIQTEPDRGLIRFTLPAGLLGPGSLTGVRLLLNTWDYDGGYRPLTQVAGPGSFGGGDGRSDPLWLDQSTVIVLD